VIHILFSGQSNAVGNGEGGTWSISPLVKVWNNGTNLMDLTQLGNAWVVPDRNAAPFEQGFNNQGVQAASYLAKLLNVEVRLFIIARNSQSIKQWHNGTVTGPMYDRIQAILGAAGVSKVDWLLWNQGSADNNYAPYYAQKWGMLVSQMTADGIIEANTPLVVSETGPWTPEINAALQDIADADPRCEMAKIGHFPTSDGTHFTGPSLVRAGWESVYALAKTQTAFHAVTPVQELDKYVYATGAGALTFPNATDVFVPFKPRYGNMAMITSEGDFMARVGGLYRISVDAYTGGAKTKIKLHSRSNDWLATIGYSGNADPINNTQMVHGEVVLNLAPGEKIKVWLSQESGVATSIQEAHGIAYNRLEIVYLG
jgi:hypothetical protein